MNLPTKIETPWESADAAALREFLESKTGQRALIHVSSQIPSLMDGSDVNQTLVRSGVVKGWGDSLQALLALTIEQPIETRATEAYPPLDLESAWKDEPTQ